jgi:hypothetical protein
MHLLLPLNRNTLFGELMVKRRRLRRLLPVGEDLRMSLHCSYRGHKAIASSAIAKMEGDRRELLLFSEMSRPSWGYVAKTTGSPGVADRL